MNIIIIRLLVALLERSMGGDSSWDNSRHAKCITDARKHLKKLGHKEPKEEPCYADY